MLGKEAVQFGNITYLQCHLLRLVGCWAKCKMAQFVGTIPIWHLWKGCPWPKEEATSLLIRLCQIPSITRPFMIQVPQSPVSHVILVVKCCMMCCLNFVMVQPTRSIVRWDSSLPVKADKTRPLRRMLSLKCSSVAYRPAVYALLY